MCFASQPRWNLPSTAPKFQLPLLLLLEWGGLDGCRLNGCCCPANKSESFLPVRKTESPRRSPRDGVGVQKRFPKWMKTEEMFVSEANVTVWGTNVDTGWDLGMMMKLPRSQSRAAAQILGTARL